MPSTWRYTRTAGIAPAPAASPAAAIAGGPAARGAAARASIGANAAAAGPFGLPTLIGCSTTPLASLNGPEVAPTSSAMPPPRRGDAAATPGRAAPAAAAPAIPNARMPGVVVVGVARGSLVSSYSYSSGAAWV